MFDIAGAIKGVTNIVDDLYTSKEEERTLDIEERKIDKEEKQIDATINLGQMGINKTEASHKSVFVAGWRPWIGWVCGMSLFYKFILYELMLWAWSIANVFIDIPDGVTTPPPLDAGQLYTIVLAMLGVGGMRSYDKKTGNVTNAVGMVKTVVPKIKEKAGFFKRMFNK